MLQRLIAALLLVLPAGCAVTLGPRGELDAAGTATTVIVGFGVVRTHAADSTIAVIEATGVGIYASPAQERLVIGAFSLQTLAASPAFEGVVEYHRGNTSRLSVCRPDPVGPLRTMENY